MRPSTILSPGDSFNRWTIIKPVRVRDRLEYDCRCDCGNRATVQGKHLVAGRSKSCGCFRKEILSKRYSAMLLGRRFGKLTVVERTGSNKRHNALWKCRCDCGNETLVSSPLLIKGRTKSCGCLTVATHGESGSRTYRIWNHMKQRCSNPNTKQWMDYGGRGIRVCERWEKYENFLADMGIAPPRLTLERGNANGNYEPENCRWATYAEQSRNKRLTRFVMIDGVEMVLQDAVDHLRRIAYFK